MPQKEIDLSIIIISSKKDYLLDCLESMRPALKKINSEIILIDNVSADRIGELAKKSFPEIVVLRREKNGGFGENNNMGMRIAKGRYVLLLNDDTKIIQKDIFSQMIKWMNEHPKAGLASCALVNPDKKTYQGSGGYFPTLLRVFLWMSFLDDIPGVEKLVLPYHPMHGYSPFDKNEKYFASEHRQDWVTGAFFLMRREAMEAAGLFDEDFFLYVEEVELSYRFYKAGWEAWYLPRWKTLHYGMSTNGSENATVMEMQNLKLFYKKHYPKWQLPILTFLLKAGALARIIIFGILSGPKVGKIYAKAFRSV